MTPSSHSSRIRSVNVLALAALTLVLMGTAAAFGAPRSHAAPAQTSGDPWEGSSFTSPSSYATTTDAVFSGVFRHTPAAPVSKVTLHVEFAATDSPASGCRPAPSDQTMTYPTSSTPTSVDPSPEPPDPSTPTTEQPKQSSDVQFSFQVPFTCNGVYDATATAFIEDPTGDVPPPLNKSLSLVGVRDAVEPPTPSSISAVAVASYTPLHVNGTRKENCTSDELGGASVVGVDGVVVEGVDGSGSIVVDVEGAVVVVE